MPNLQKWVNLSFLACGVVAWVFLREIFTLAFNPLGWNRVDWVVSPADIAGIASGLFTFVVLLRSNKTNTFLTEVLAELSKVTWPPRKETVLSTGIVSAMLAIITVCVMLFDTLWGWVVERFLY